MAIPDEFPFRATVNPTNPFGDEPNPLERSLPESSALINGDNTSFTTNGGVGGTNRTLAYEFVSSPHHSPCLPSLNRPSKGGPYTPFDVPGHENDTLNPMDVSVSLRRIIFVINHALLGSRPRGRRNGSQLRTLSARFQSR